MEDSFKENGLIITWMEWVFTPGPMVAAIWASIKTIKRMDMEYINGLMEESTLDNGCVENNTDLVHIKQ